MQQNFTSALVCRLINNSNGLSLVCLIIRFCRILTNFMPNQVMNLLTLYLYYIAPIIKRKKGLDIMPTP